MERVPDMNLKYGFYLGGVGLFTTLFILTVLAIATYAMAGWAGFLAASAGFLINIFIMVPIFYIGAMSSEGYKLCCMAIVHEIVTDRLYKFAWAARNYMIYVRLATGGGTILLGLCLMGCALFFLNDDSSIFLDFTGVYGILVGIMMVYLIKTLTVGAIVSVSKNFDLDVYKSGVVVEVAQDRTIFDFLRNKFWLTMKWVYFIFILVMNLFNSFNY